MIVPPRTSLLTALLLLIPILLGACSTAMTAPQGIAVAPVERAAIDRVRSVNPSLRVRRYAVVPR